MGIVADEFFDLGRMGGFGWMARQVAKVFNSSPQLDVVPVFLNAEPFDRNEFSPSEMHDTKVICRIKGARDDYARNLNAEEFDVLLLIDYRPKYNPTLELLPDTPLILWIRDPWPRPIWEMIQTLRFPNDTSTQPQGIDFYDCTGINKYCMQSGRAAAFAVTTRSLIPLASNTYGISEPVSDVLPNILDVNVQNIQKSLKPSVVFLGRLDPIKRPWLFLSLARRFSSVDFYMLGHSHFEGVGSWVPNSVPPNVKMLGHVDGSAKMQVLKSAWVLVNTSIHEALAISWLEALACETPILSCQDQEDVVRRFGHFIGEWPGGGCAALPAFEQGLKMLLVQHEKRQSLGKSGRVWVSNKHSIKAFTRAFNYLCNKIGIER